MLDGDNTDTIDEGVEPEAVTEIPEVEAPAEGGQADEAGETGTVEDSFDIDEYGDRVVTVKVNGEDVTVPLKEALSGYQRQADYTRKTQELSRAQALWDALESNPEGTMQFLASQYGGRNAAPQQAAQPEVDDGFDPDDPVGNMVREMRSELEELRGWRTETLLDQTLTQLQSKYGDDFNQQEVIAAAAQAQITHPSQLEGVFRDMMFDKYYATAKAREEAAGSANAERAAREAAKAELANTVTSGNGAPRSSAGNTPASFDSLEDAFEAAKASLGVTF